MSELYHVGESIKLQKQEATIEKCKECGKLMVNLDADQIARGDLAVLKGAGVRISNPETDKAVCVSCDYQTIGHKIARFFETDMESDDNHASDESFFTPSGGFLGGSSFGGFSGFGGGSFSGGGASGSF